MINPETVGGGDSVKKSPVNTKAYTALHLTKLSVIEQDKQENIYKKIDENNLVTYDAFQILTFAFPSSAVSLSTFLLTALRSYVLMNDKIWCSRASTVQFFHEKLKNLSKGVLMQLTYQ